MSRLDISTAIWQFIIIFVMSGLATYSIVPYLEIWSLAVFGGLLLIGIVPVIFVRFGMLPFSAGTFLAVLPAILYHNAIDIGLQEYKGIYTGSPMFGQTEMTMPFYLTLAIGIILVFGFLTISRLYSIQKEYRMMVKSGAEGTDAADISQRTVSFVLKTYAICAVVAAVIIMMLRLIQQPLAGVLENFSWSIVVFGTVSLVLIAVFLYWIGTYRRQNEK